jgi:radical SAM superfamily enzyme YgiQ (UPF0313 family)
MRILFVIYDNDSQIDEFPLGAAYLNSFLRKYGYKDIVIYNQDIYHFPEAHLTDYLDRNHFDVICVGIIGGYYQYAKLKSICAAINKSKDRPILILGGYGPSPEPQFFMQKTGADFCVIGEGELPLLNLLNEINGSRNYATVKSIMYRDNNEFVATPREKAIKDLDNIPFPAWDLFPIDAYAVYKPAGAVGSVRTMPILTCRGCMYSCNFCYRMESGYRTRSYEAIIEEIERLNKDYSITFIRLRDELLMATEKRVIGFCEALLKSGIKVQFDCNGRLNTAKPNVLKLMKKAGCVYINYGIESLDQKVLDLMNKHQTIEEIHNGIEATLSEGINPGFNILWNNIADNEETLKKGVEFLKKYNKYSETRTIKPVTPYPGSSLYYNAINQGLLEGPEDFYENKHLNSDLIAVNFMEMSDGEAYKLLYEANKELLKDHYGNICSNAIEAHRRLYIEGDVTFRGIRHANKARQK